MPYTPTDSSVWDTSIYHSGSVASIYHFFFWQVHQSSIERQKGLTTSQFHITVRSFSLWADDHTISHCHWMNKDLFTRQPYKYIPKRYLVAIYYPNCTYRWLVLKPVCLSTNYYFFLCRYISHTVTECKVSFLSAFFSTRQPYSKVISIHQSNWIYK